MKLSMKADYAFRVLFSLVEHFGRGPVSIRALAERNGVPKAFLEHIMLDLKAEGWVKSVAGKHGGYELSRHPEKITMGEIVRYFEGEEAEAKPQRRARRGAKAAAAPEASTRYRRLMREVREQAAGMMDRATLAAVFAGRPVGKDDVLAQEFGGGAGI
jgi:Rrf2 family protein